MRKSAALVAMLAVFSMGMGVGCSSAPEEDADTGEAAVSARNQTATSFGLTDKEVVLTLDDGPGPRTVELAEWLAAERVPAVFFMVGKNAKANPAAVKRVAELSRQNNGLFIIANHSMTHTTPLPKQGVAGATSEIMDADAILAENILEAQSTLPSATSFFRPPYGAFTSLGQANIDRVNAGGAAKYTGPVFWDIGGELNATYSADWACWGKVTMDRCTQGYVDEAVAKKRGIILAHDVHAKTVDMLTGKNTANGRSLVKDLRSKGFKFVSLRSHEDAVARFDTEQRVIASTPEITIDAQVTTATEGRVVVDVRASGASKVIVAFDDKAPSATFESQKQVDVTLPPGQHFVTVTALDATGVVKKQQRFTFIVSAEIRPSSPETQNGNAVCVSFDLMKAGQLFRLYHGKVACDAPGAYSPLFTEDCYKFKGTLRTTRDPRLVGAGEWSTDFDLTYKADPTDKSKIGFVMDAATGEIETGKRSFPGTTRKEVGLSFDPAQIKCEKGLWPGKFQYASGQTEDVLFQMLKDPRTGETLHGNDE